MIKKMFFFVLHGELFGFMVVHRFALLQLIVDTLSDLQYQSTDWQTNK